MTHDVYMLPDTLAHWPWTRRINPAYEETRLESSRWINSFNAFSPAAQKAFDRCDFSRLVALAYPDESKDHLSAACDMMQLFFVFDEYSDQEQEAAVRIMADAIMGGMKAPDVHQAHLLGEVSRQFWMRLMKIANAETQQRFIESFENYTDAVVTQARDRECAFVRDVADYFAVRRHTIGTQPCFVLLQLDLNLPDEVAYHPAIVKLETFATDMIILGNDLYSYNVEQARGDDAHNILTIVRQQYRLDLDGALQWLEDYHGHLVTGFLDGRAALPSFGGECDVGVTQYVEGLGNWVRANESWSFESQRYFGSQGLETQRHRRVELLHHEK
ncbi:terpenoid synthase [Exidia glandulosa HHB12029]|uniref:Terpene synthase n=1 Tax=Exidia glandulosa HHB12029 TaxID=1314781 RepID=A0A165FU65_EXIGL|nr:terpenoid synthase [Exidia glandulosa HHB12029]